VPAIWHSAKKENITPDPSPSLTHSFTHALPVPPLLPAGASPSPRPPTRRARRPPPRPRPPARRGLPCRHALFRPSRPRPSPSPSLARRPDTAAVPPSLPLLPSPPLRAPTPPRTHTVVAAVTAPRPQPSSPRLALNCHHARHHATAW
jgi:hypothetical protein